MSVLDSDDGLGPAAGVSFGAKAPSAGAALFFPCSASQNRCWFINSLSPGNPALNIALRWEVAGRLGAATVEQAFQAIIDRHEILRTRFFEKDGEAMQEVLPRLKFKLSVIDLSMLAEDERLKEALTLATREAHLSFDLSTAPPIRVTFLRLSGERAVLLVTVHQIAFDGWSIRVLANEFGLIAEALNAGRLPDLPQLPLQYGDYCLWQKEYFASGVFADESAYWKRKLGGAPYFEATPDHERLPRPTYKGEIIAAILPPILGDLMEETARHRNLTLFSFGCAVMVAALNRYTGQSDVIFGTQIAGRDDPDLENMIGMFINNLVMRCDASGDPTFDELLGRVNETVQDALINQRMPFDKLVEILNPPRDPQRTPLISMNFTLLRDVMDHRGYGDFELCGQPSLSAGSLYDFIFFLVHWPNGWRLAMEYNPDLFERQTAERLLDFLLQALQEAVSHPEQRLSSLTPPPRDLVDAPEPREDLDAIEAALRRDPEVTDAAAIRASDPSGLRRPYAFVTPAARCVIPLETLPARLGAWLDGALPKEAARPSGVSVLLALPRNLRGEIDYRSLPAPPPVALAPAPAGRSASEDVERRVAAIWRSLLKVEAIVPTSNFFDLGGHSLLAIRLMARIVDEFGVRIDAATLFEAPTLQAFAARLPRKDIARQGPKLVQIQPEGDGTPIIAINNSVLYYGLARRLGTSRPFIGIPLIEPTLAERGRVRPLDEIAADYISIIRQAQPGGPYILCGLCIAGALAYECARQLTDAGESVPLLILSDLWAPGYMAARPWWSRAIYQCNYRFYRLRYRIRRWRRGEASLSDIVSDLKILRKSGLLHLLGRIGFVNRHGLPKEAETPEDEAFLSSLEAARNAYKISPTSSDVVILQSDEIVTAFADPNMGWSDLARGRLFIRRVPGPHLGMFQGEGAEVIADFLQPLLTEIDGNRDRQSPRAI